MQLKCIHDHMKGKAVLCNGTVYRVDKDGIAEVNKPEDVARLLAAKAWIKADSSDEQKSEAKAVPKPSEKKSKDSQKEDSEKIGKSSVSSPDDSTIPDPNGSAVVAAQDQFEAKKTGEANEAPSERGDDDWPDPDMSMSKAYLQQMATAYGVTFEDKTSKKQLIALIEDAMYE